MLKLMFAGLGAFLLLTSGSSPVEEGVFSDGMRVAQNRPTAPTGSLEPEFMMPPLPSGMFRHWCQTSMGSCRIDIERPVSSGSRCFCTGGGQAYSGAIR
jgi:hypothetical protein